ncbi:hypothetical protein COLO4_25329 [Corchorus olitorius]|uniref:Uncharacterized protein n=1 Tax=Corchorus olitorius TaxID=93759 RepID=A0A1R3I3K6_9ROSI|nr:hypothetical protein COLO4_25329 [Corchorus olitorius]
MDVICIVFVLFKLKYNSNAALPITAVIAANSIITAHSKQTHTSSLISYPPPTITRCKILRLPPTRCQHLEIDWPLQSILRTGEEPNPSSST